MAEEPIPYSYFGICLDISDNEIICGALFDENDVAVRSGAAYIYNLETLVGTSIVNENTITIYPNPAKSILNIEANTNLIGEEIIIYNSLGQKVYQTKIINSKLNITALLAGSYFFRIETKTDVFLSAFLVN